MRTNVSNNIYNMIKNDILIGELNFGDKIIEIDYSNKYNISRTPLREAIKQLEIEGIIERLPNGRLRIMEISEEKINEIFEIRIALEKLLFKSIIENNYSIQEISENLAMTKYHLDFENWDAARKLFFQFNDILYRTSNLEFTVKILKHYDFIISKLKRNALQNIERIKEAYEEHLDLYESLKNKNIEKIESINKLHLNNARKIILDYFKKRKEQSEAL
ncbi:GntR family transcriptional regulator [Cetobacterium sp. SF1]|uniref:GntR family transcriptional regulator n=1 Tax=unclassified Cetobacterium TaxID=2630983 RepID=UPI003CEC9E9B